jgi:hypothetical protein
MQKYYKSVGVDINTKLPETFLIPLSERKHTSFSFLMSPFKGGFSGCLQRFKSQFQAEQIEAQGETQTWIYKPGEQANQGNGIHLFNSM